MHTLQKVNGRQNRSLVHAQMLRSVQHIQKQNELKNLFDTRIPSLECTQALMRQFIISSYIDNVLFERKKLPEVSILYNTTMK